jgi:tRNA(adenine34) deaminase
MSFERDERYMEYALHQAQKAYESDEVPVGAIVVHSEEILAAAHDAKEATGDPTAHAELLALRQAAQAMGSWRLDGCELYVTLEPCPMCVGAMLQARISRLIYGARNSRWGAIESVCSLHNVPQFNHRIQVRGGVREEACADLLQCYFRLKRQSGEKSVEVRNRVDERGTR